jgi:hypothetical protein
MGNQQINNNQIWEYFIPERCVYRKKCKSGSDFGDKSSCLRRIQEPNLNVKEMFVMSNKYVRNDHKLVKKKIRVLRRRISRLEKQL